MPYEQNHPAALFHSPGHITTVAHNIIHNRRPPASMAAKCANSY